MLPSSAVRLAPLLLLLAGGPALATSAQTAGHASGRRQPRQYTFEVVRQFPHDPAAFTQGLAYHQGYLYEGTGIKGQSSLRKVRIESGEVVQRAALPAEFFGEGITVWRNRIVQLTWLSHTGFVYGLDDFRRLRQFSYPGEGWGIATDGHDLFVSDGTSVLRVLDPITLGEKRRIPVHDGAHPVAQLNELEFGNGPIFANIWHTDRIARISPETGEIAGWIDLNGLLSPVYRRGPEAVLNGIAYDPQGRRLFVTGKLWPILFEIKVVPTHALSGPKVQGARSGGR